MSTGPDMVFSFYSFTRKWIAKIRIEFVHYRAFHYVKSVHIRSFSGPNACPISTPNWKVPFDCFILFLFFVLPFLSISQKIYTYICIYYIILYYIILYYIILYYIIFFTTDAFIFFLLPSHYILLTHLLK